MVHLQERIAGRLRHGGMGRVAAVLERKGGNVWRVLRRSDAVSRSDCAPAASGGNLPHRHGLELSRWLDVPRRSIRAMVQRILDHGLSRKHNAPASRPYGGCFGWLEGSAATFLSGFGCAFLQRDCTLFYGLAAAPE